MKYGWYSPTAKRIFGSVVYSTPSGGTVEVTHTSLSKRKMSYKDSVFVGAVTEPVPLVMNEYTTQKDFEAVVAIFSLALQNAVAQQRQNAGLMAEFASKMKGFVDSCTELMQQHEERIKALEEDKPEFPTAFDIEPSSN